MSARSLEDRLSQVSMTKKQDANDRVCNHFVMKLLCVYTNNSRLEEVKKDNLNQEPETH